VAAGFVDFEITWRADVYNDAPQATSAANFGTLGINFRARKAANEQEWAAALAALNCEVPAPIVALLGPDSFYDAGWTGYAAGPLEMIAAQLSHLDPGQTLEVRATDPSVANELPAWCRRAGHELVTSDGDRYLIRRKD
jgi:TusA-related sulfurtransferase